MKKLKILTVLGVLMAMGIVACNKGGEEEKPAESGQPSQSQSAGDSSDSGGSQAHTHSWDAGTVTTEPGCVNRSVDINDYIDNALHPKALLLNPTKIK